MKQSLAREAGFLHCLVVRPVLDTIQAASYFSCANQNSKIRLRGAHFVQIIRKGGYAMESVEWQSVLPGREHESRPGNWLASRLLTLVVALFPVCATAGDEVQRDGRLIQGPVRAEDTWVGEGTSTGVKAKNWVYIVKVGEYTYTANVDRVGGIFAAKGPKEEDWPPDSTVQVTFFHRMGSLYMDLKSPTGKEEESLWVFSKKGPDGTELCGKIKCEKTPEDTED
jgi:hypothetical protein